MKQNVLLLWGMVVIAGCVARSNTTLEPSPSSSHIALTEPLVGETPDSTESVVEHEQVIFQDCPQVLTELPAELNLAGTLVLLDETSSTYLVVMENFPNTQARHKLEDGSNYFSVSPNGRWLAYEARTNRAEPSIVIVDSGGDIVNEIPWEDSWLLLVDWLNNSNLVVIVREVQGEPSSLISLDAITEEAHPLKTDLENIWDMGPIREWELPFGNPAIYSPDGTRLIYPTAMARNPANLGGELIVWDIVEDKEIAYLEMSGTFFGNSPQWSPDGERVVVNKSVKGREDHNDDLYPRDHDLFSLSIEGNIERLTYLSDAYEEVVTRQLSWSPDGQKIAFWAILAPAEYPDALTGNPEVQYERLMLLDFESGSLRDLCVPGGDVLTLAPIWSPISQHIVVKHQVDEDNSVVYLLDLQAQTVYQIAENAIPIGWMISEE